MGDYVRWSPPHYEGAEQTAGGALFLALNRGKRSIRLDLKTERGQGGAAAPGPRRRRAARVVPAGRARPPRASATSACASENPGLVYCAITGYGQDGPNRDRSGHDMNYLGLNGLLGLTGEADGPPVQAAGQIADLGGGALMAAFGILAALRERERSGEGQLVDVSMSDGVAVVAGDGRRRGYFADGPAAAPRRARSSPGRSSATARIACADG